MSNVLCLTWPLWFHTLFYTQLLTHIFHCSFIFASHLGDEKPASMEGNFTSCSVSFNKHETIMLHVLTAHSGTHTEVCGATQTVKTTLMIYFIIIYLGCGCFNVIRSRTLCSSCLGALVLLFLSHVCIPGSTVTVSVSWSSPAMIHHWMQKVMLFLFFFTPCTKIALR